MADQIMTVVDLTKAGVPSISAHANAKAGNAAGTDYFYFPNDGKTILVAVVGATPKQITFTPVADRFGRTETLAPTPTASSTAPYGPFDPELWNNTNGMVKFQPAAGGLVTDIYIACRVANPK